MTEAELIERPTSCAIQIVGTRTMPVSGSTSTSATHALYEYAGEGPRYFNNRMIIDACRPYDRLTTFPAVARITEDEARDVRANWPELFDADGKARKSAAQASRVEMEAAR